METERQMEVISFLFYNVFAAGEKALVFFIPFQPLSIAHKTA